jgi:hypothetical protein
MDTERLRQLTGTAELDKPLITAAEFSVTSHQSSRPVWMKPLPKFAMVMILLLPVVALAGTFLTGGSRSEPAQTALDRSTRKPPNQTSQADNAAANLQQEVARLKAKSALDGQAKIEKQLAKQPNSKPIKAVDKTPAKPPAIAQTARNQVVPVPKNSTVAIQSQPPQMRTAAISRPEVIPVRESQNRSRNLPSVSVSTPRSSKLIEPSLEPEINSQERWQELVKLGSYGSVRPESIPAPESAIAQAPVNQAKLTNWENPTEPLPLESMEEPQTKSLIAGTTATGILEIPLVFDGAKSNERFVITLTEPIADSAGNPTLPANSRLLVQVDGISATGRLQLSALSATWEEDGQTKELTLPASAIQIRGEQGQPLIAQQFEDKGKELAALDAGQFALSTIRGASSQLIQPNTRVQTGNGSTVITQENQRPNVLAGAIQGGADGLLNTIAERNKRAAAEIQQRPPIRYIAAGTTVQVFINQSVQLPL